MKTIASFFRGLFITLGILFFVILLTGGWAASHIIRTNKPHELPAQYTLTLSLAQPMTESVPRIVRAIAGDSAPPSLREWVLALERAAKDEKLSAVYIRAVGGEVTLTQVEELRSSIARVRKAGKQVVFFTDTFGEMDNGTGLYYLASAADKIILQPSGFVGLMGMGIEQPFARGLLDRYGVLPEFEKRRAYKSAMDTLTEKQMTPENRQMLTRLIGGMSEAMMQSIAADRKMGVQTLTTLRDTSPLSDDAVKQLVDAVQYEDEIKLPTESIALEDYQRSAPELDAKPTTPHIALVDAEGEIVRGQGGGQSAFASATFGADDFVQTLAEIQANKNISAVIIRLNSPGGSAIASETMMRAVQHLKSTGRPVIISMGDVAASGGYYLASAGTKILAQPSTLTGSIGVIVGKMSLGGLSNQYGVHWDEVTVGKNAALFANGRGFNPDERAAVARAADSVYATFKSRVATGRKLSAKAVEAIAQGQVWSGKEALANKLVDELGGLTEAVAAAKRELGLLPDARVMLVSYPDEEDPALLFTLLLHQMGITARAGVMSSLGLDKFMSLITPPETLESPHLRLLY